MLNRRQSTSGVILRACVASALVLGAVAVCHGDEGNIAAKLKKDTDVGVAFNDIPQGYFDVYVSLIHPDDWYIVTNKQSSRWVSKSGDTIWNRTSADEEIHIWEGCGVTAPTRNCWPGVLFAGNLTKHTSGGGGGGGEPPGFNASVADIDIDVDSLGLHSDESDAHHWPPDGSYEEDETETGDGIGGLLLPPSLYTWSGSPPSTLPGGTDYKTLRLTLRPRWVGTPSSDGKVGALTFSTAGQGFALYELTGDDSGTLVSSIRVPPNDGTFIGKKFAILTNQNFTASGSITATFIWDSNLRGGEYTATDYVRVAPIQGIVKFIRQDANNSEFDAHGNDACHMVSKAVTDQNLPATATFDGPAGDTPDQETFRVQVEGMATGLQQSIKVKLEVVRGANAVYTHQFDVIEGTVNGSPAYRTNQHVRLVSNAVDDGYAGDQTPLVKLGDYVRATLLLNNSPISVRSLPVGRPPEEDGPKAIRSAKVHFVTVSGSQTDPGATVDRMSQNWAQLGIRFKLQDQKTVAPVNNVLTVSGQATSDGELQVTLNDPKTNTTTSVVSSVYRNESVGVTVNRLVGRIRATTAFWAKTCPVQGNGLTDFRGSAVYVDVKNGREGEDAVGISNLNCTATGITFDKPQVNFHATSLDNLTVAVLGLCFRGFEFDITAIAVGDAQTEIWVDDQSIVGVAWPHSMKADYGDRVNALVVVGRTVMTTPSAPFTVGHEAGHLLLDGEFHEGDTHNLMHAPTSQTDAYDATKRLDSPGYYDQNTRVRNSSGPNTQNNILNKE